MLKTTTTKKKQHDLHIASKLLSIHQPLCCAVAIPLVDAFTIQSYLLKQTESVRSQTGHQQNQK